MLPFAGDAIQGRRRPAIDAAPADIKASNNRPASTLRAPWVPFSASTHTLLEDSARSSTWLALGQPHQVGDFLRLGAGSLAAGATARAIGRGYDRVVASSAMRSNSESQQPSDAATTPQGRAWLDARIQ